MSSSQLERSGQSARAGAAPVGAAPPAGPGVTGSRSRRWSTSRVLLPVGTTLGLLALWEALARAGVLPAEVSPVSSIASWLLGEITGGTLWTALGQTMWHWFAGLVIGGVVGIALGVTIGSVPFIQRLLDLPLEFLRPIPSIVYLPLLILLMGSRSQTAIVLASIGALWPLLFQSIYGVRAIDQQALETGRVFGLRPRQILLNITLPSVLPYLASGLRIASSLSLIVAITTELVGGVPGLGTQMSGASQNGSYPAMYGLVFVIGIFGLLLNSVLERAEHHLLRWHVSHRVVNA